MLCVYRVVDVSLVVTDVIISAGCANDLAVIGGVLANPDWVVHAPAGKGANVHAARLPVSEGDYLTFAAINATEAKPDIRCGITVVWTDAPLQPKTLERIPGF